MDKYAKTVGKLTVERDWTVGKKNLPQKSNDLLGTPSKSLDLLTKRAMVQVQTDNDKILALSRKHQLLGISRSYNYYTPAVNQTKETIKRG